jgi:ABC-type multidrug transport system permease subunit
MSISIAAQAGGLALRSLRNIRRLPSAFIPALLMPLSQVVSFSGTYRGATDIPGFPTDRSVNWYLPLAVVMGCAFAGVSAGFSMIRDLQTGFYDRLRMAPARRPALLLGPMIAAVVRALIVVVLVFAVGSLLGVRLTDGPLGLVMLAAAGIGMAVIGTGWGLGLAYRFKDMRAAAVMQLTLFLSLFLTEAQTPLDVMQGWLHGVARVNPLTNVLRLARTGFLGEITWHDSWGGLLALAVLGGLAMLFAATGLRSLDR